MRLFFAPAVLALLMTVRMLPFHDIGWATARAQTPDPSSSGGQRLKYVGVGSCAANNCHGSVTPGSIPGIQIKQNEHYTWLKKDKHAKAYDVLLQGRSVKIAQHLRLTGAPEKSPKCLSCHALNIPAEQRGPYYQVEDGVSCEVCHGPAEHWLGTHITRGYAASVQVGMYDTKNLTRRAEKCVACHVGDANQNVDHEMIAAGHPDLGFELDTFTALMPPHWRPPRGAWLEAQAWTIGQAVALRETTKRLARRAQQRAAPGWPEFAEFDCFACHHEVRNVASTYYKRSDHGLLKAGDEWLASWRQTRGYAGVAGIPPWDTARHLVFRHLVGVVAPDSRATIDQELTTLTRLMEKIGATDPQQVETTATRVAQLVEPLVPQVGNVKFDEKLVLTLLRNISSDRDTLAAADLRTAEQAAMAIEALFTAYRKQVKTPNDKAIQDTIRRLFDVLEKPEQYDPQQCSTHLQTLHGLFTQQ
jgi:hypothetical protein